MRRVTINSLRCPRCRRGPLLPESDTAELIFGPIRCPECQATYPVAEGVPDLVVERARPSHFAQKSMESPLIARAYERYLRPSVQWSISRRQFDRDSEFLIYRAMLGNPEGPVLDLGSGTGLFARRLARDPHFPTLIGMDVSRAMIEEGVAQTREAGVMVDFIRAEAPYLPFLDQTLGAVLQTGSLHFVEDAARLFIEVGRVLRPGGHYLASTYLPPGMAGAFLHKQLGLHPRGEDELRSGIAAAGLVNFERLVMPPFILVRAEKPR